MHTVILMSGKSHPENHSAYLERDQGNYTDVDLKLSPGLQVISCTLERGGGQWRFED